MISNAALHLSADGLSLRVFIASPLALSAAPRATKGTSAGAVGQQVRDKNLIGSGRKAGSAADYDTAARVASASSAVLGRPEALLREPTCELLHHGPTPFRNPLVL